MAVPLTLRHLENSSLVGKPQEFRQDRVRIGRRPGNDIVFGGPQEMIVSGSHAELRAEAGGWTLTDSGSTNGTFVDGKRISGTVALKPGAVVMLGQGGPTFSVHWLDEAELAERTLAMPGRGPVENKTLPVLPAGGAAPAPSPRPAPVPAPAPAPRPVAPQPAAPAAPGGGGGAKQGIGMETLNRVLVQERQKERSRLLTLLAPVAVLLVAAAGVTAWLLGSGKGEADWPRVYAQVKPAVYLVCTRKGKELGSVLTPQATAWSYKPGWLATNAHVAGLFDGLGADEALVARSSDTPPKDLKIEAVVFHPDQKVFQQLCESYQPIEPDARMLSLQGQFDVALLKVAAADLGKQAPPLKVADRKRDESLATGSPVSLVGFPQENRNINPQAPVPNNAPGTLSKRMDLFFGQPLKPEVTDIFAYDLNSAGGASGSPVVDGSGVVIGLNAAGDYQQLAGTRIRAGLAYGPRVDLLEEIPTSGNLTPPPLREQVLKALVEKRFQDGVANIEVTARSVFEGGLKSQSVDLKELEITPDPVKTLDLSTKLLRRQIDVKKDEYFALMLVATQSPVKLLVRIRADKNELKVPGVKYLWFVGPELIEQEGKITIEAQVSLEGSGFATSKAKLIVLRATRK